MEEVMGVYLNNPDTALASGKLVKCPYGDLHFPPVVGEVYLCLCSPFNSLLVVTSEREMRRVILRVDSWFPKAVYVARIYDIVKWLPCAIGDITYGQDARSWRAP
jgi:hypothetical protein